MRATIAAMGFALLAAEGVHAGEGEARFTVAVTVPVRVVLDVRSEPEHVTVTAEDVTRGYVDVAAEYRVRHNDRGGYRLEIDRGDGVARAIEVRGLGANPVLVVDTVEIRRPGDHFLDDLSLELRILLDASTRPGTFDLPVQVSALPL
jgi:hypothetical protein